MALIDSFQITPQVTLGARRPPAPPRSLIVQPGTQKAVLTWAGPVDMRGVDGWRVFVDSDKQLFATIYDPATKKIEIPVTAGGSRFAAVSSFTKIGRTTIIESARIPTVVTANSDKFVVTGTGGETAGTSPVAPPEYADEPSGGLRNKDIL